jgi:hypothetical protein
VSRALQHQLLSHLGLAVAVLDLPLTRAQLERLAVELTPGVAAMTAERDATIADLEPVPYAVTEADDGERVVREFAGCRLSIDPDVAEDAPAALLGLELQTTQSDVRALDVHARADAEVAAYRAHRDATTGAAPAPVAVDFPPIPVSPPTEAVPRHERTLQLHQVQAHRARHRKEPACS